MARALLEELAGDPVALEDAARELGDRHGATPVVSTPALESYVTAGELAELMGVSVRTVRAWTSAGMPSESWGMRVRRYLPSESMAWARTRDTMNVEPGPRSQRARANSQPKE
jgi:hypothetical protein